MCYIDSIQNEGVLKVLIKRKSVISGIERTRNIPVDPEDFAIWQKGYSNIQDVMPYLNDNDREFILSGITPDEWDSMFSDQIEDIIADSFDDEAAF
jgi:hypothetical protein